MRKNNPALSGAPVRGSVYSGISAAGLVAGMLCCMTILLDVPPRPAHDRLQASTDRVYRLAREVRPLPGAAAVPASRPCGKGLAAQPVRFMKPFPKRLLIRHGDQGYYEEGLLWVEAAVFEVYGLALLRGNPRTALREPFTIVLTEKMARKYFGEEDPIGQVLTVYGWTTNAYTVTGILKEVPGCFPLPFDFLASLAGEASRYNFLIAGAAPAPGR